LVDFGSGYVNSSNCQECNMTTYNQTDDTCCAGGWTSGGGFNVPDGLWIENTGNQPVNLNVTSNSTADQFIGGTNPVFQWNFTSGNVAQNFTSGISADDSAVSCETHNISNQLFNWHNNTIWTDVITGSFWACGNETLFPFNFTNSKNEVEVNFRISIPQDAPTGSKFMTLTAIGTST
jgi:hypothetical protein